MSRGLVLAAPSSGCGKTVITLALLRALNRKGLQPGSLKIGPDYIDPGFHRAASGGPCLNFDTWAMRPETLDAQAANIAIDCDIILAEGVTGLFDGAADGTGSTADAADQLGWPIVLIVDVHGQGASAAALVEGFAQYRDGTTIAGVIFNQVGSQRHRQILSNAMASTGIPIKGMIPHDPDLALPDRHLGLVQAGEQPELAEQIDRAATVIENELELDHLLAIAAPIPRTEAIAPSAPIPPPGQRIAIASDEAFSFCYPNVLDGWRQEGATFAFFSPLDNQSPAAETDAVYLPGGYPELHASRLGGNKNFLRGLKASASSGATIYGECGGFMVLGETLTDRNGKQIPMAGLLPIHTSFASPRLQLGYRKLSLPENCFLGKGGAKYRGHEFHYSVQTGTERPTPLFEATDAINQKLPPVGCRRGNVMGSYVHLIDRCP